MWAPHLTWFRHVTSDFRLTGSRYENYRWSYRGMWQWNVNWQTIHLTRASDHLYLPQAIRPTKPRTCISSRTGDTLWRSWLVPDPSMFATSLQPLGYQSTASVIPASVIPVYSLWGWYPTLPHTNWHIPWHSHTVVWVPRTAGPMTCQSSGHLSPPCLPPLAHHVGPVTGQHEGLDRCDQTGVWGMGISHRELQKHN